jgi:post-segregation antitoxin (ccd killing protein)
MKNITVSVDVELYQRARIKAAEMNTSVSALVKAFLVQITNEETDWERRKRLEREIIASIEAFSAADRLGRDEVHDRNAIP